MKKYLSARLPCLLLAACLLCFSVCSCGKTDAPDDSDAETNGSEESISESAPESAEESAPRTGEHWIATEEAGVYRLGESFPEDQPTKVSVSGGVLLLETITPGMDSFSATLVTKDLYDGTELGDLELAEGGWIIGRLRDGGFSVLDPTTGECRLFGKDCVQSSSFFVSAGGFITLFLLSEDGRYALCGEQNTGYPILFDAESGSGRIDDSGVVLSRILGERNGVFYFTDPKNALYSVRSGGNAVLIESDFTAYFVPPYVLAATRKGYNLRTVTESVFTFFPAETSGEYPVAAADGFLAATRDEGLTLYDFGRRKSETLLEGGECTSYTSFDGGVCVTLVRFGGTMTVCVIVPEEVEFTRDLDFRESGDGDLEDPIVREWADGADAEKAKAVRETYGVVVGYESDEFEDQVFWYDFSFTDAGKAGTYLGYAEEYFAMLPEGLLREIHPGKEPVLFFCEEIEGDVAGFACEYMKHPFIALEAQGEKGYFLENLAHEVFHLLFEQNDVIRDSLPEWDALTPAEYYLNSYEAYQDAFDYTPFGDGGPEEARFLTSYARTFPAEDRAVTGQYLFLSAYEGALSGYFKNYPHLKEKAAVFCRLLHENYAACRNETPYWETIFNYKGD